MPGIGPHAAGEVDGAEPERRGWRRGEHRERKEAQRTTRVLLQKMKKGLSILCRHPQDGEEFSHSGPKLFVMVIDRCGMVQVGLWLGSLGSGQYRPDDLLAENHQRSHGPQAARCWLIASRGPDLVNHTLAPQLLEIISGAAWSIVAVYGTVHAADLLR